MYIVKATSYSISQALDILKNGGTIVYPTDTAYALGADPASAMAVSKIYKIKGRPKKKALPLIAASFAMVEDFFKMNKIERRLAKRYWPGALSLVLEIRKKKTKTRNPYSHILQNMRIRELAVRVPSKEVARELSQKLGRPITSTSANVSGAGEFYHAKKIYEHFKRRKYKPDLILDNGMLQKRSSSTIIKVVDGKVDVLRKGPVKI